MTEITQPQRIIPSPDASLTGLQTGLPGALWAYAQPGRCWEPCGLSRARTGLWNHCFLQGSNPQGVSGSRIPQKLLIKASGAKPLAGMKRSGNSEYRCPDAIDEPDH